MSGDHIPESVRRRVAEAAGHRCCYCRTAQEISGAQMHVDHIVPLALGGTSEERNLCLACAWCNSYKGSKRIGIDPLTGAEVSLFPPRVQNWVEHFRWSDDGTEVIGLTPCGRTTVVTMRLNNEYVVSARRNWVLAGWHPPKE